MSMYGLVDYEYYMMRDPQPTWVRSERYEYCEPFERTSLLERSGLKKLPFVQFLISLF